MIFQRLGQITIGLGILLGASAPLSAAAEVVPRVPAAQLLDEEESSTLAHAAPVDAELLNEQCARQITHSNQSLVVDASFSADGRKLVFSSPADLVGRNSDRSFELYLFDTVTSRFRQITQNASQAQGIFAPSISGDGRYVVYLEADGGRIYLYDLRLSRRQQISAEGALGYPQISANGLYVAYHRNTDPSDGTSREVFLYDVEARATTQITSTGFGFSSFGSLSADGNILAFTSPLDLAGQNPAHEEEIFVLDRSTGSYTQLTRTIRTTFLGMGTPHISNDGSRVAFTSDRIAAGTDEEVFVHDLSAGVTHQITHGNQPGFDPTPSISADGTRIAFTSRSDYAGQNQDGNGELFVYDFSTDAFTQLTDTRGGGQPLPGQSRAVMAPNGGAIAFVSNRNIGGGGSPGVAELVLYDPSCPFRSRPDLRFRTGSSWLGDNEYNRYGGEPVVGFGSGGPPATVRPSNLYLSVRNAGQLREGVRLRGDGSNNMLRIRYFRGRVDVTERVVAGTYVSQPIAPGHTVVFRMEMTVQRNASRTFSINRSVAALSPSDPLKADYVVVSYDYFR